VVLDLLIGLPGDRPGGLLLSVLLGLGAGAAALALGFAYAAACSAGRAFGLPLQGVSALLRGIPLILLAFGVAELVSVPLALAGLLALTLYSLSHTGEILRGFLAAYPAENAAQARVMGIGPIREWVTLRIPHVLRDALGALQTHWISLLKDSGALVVIGVGELTTTAKLLTDRSADTGYWLGVLGLAAGFYLLTTLALIAAVRRIGGPVGQH